MAIENRYKLTLNTKTKMVREIPEVVANDNVVFEIEKIYDEMEVIVFSTSYTYKLASLKPSGKSVIRDGVLNNGVLTFTLGSSEMLEAGKVEGTVQIFDNNMKRISTAQFMYMVRKDPALQGGLPTDDKTLVIANESLLLDTVKKAEDQKKRVDDLIAGTPQPSEVVDARGGFPVLRDRLDKVTSDLAETQTKKADITYVDTKTAAVASGSPKGTYATLTDLQTAYPTGTTGTYVVTADGKWYYWNGSAWTAGGTYQSTGIPDRSIAPTQTTFFVASKNLFNKNTASIGYYLNSSGALLASASYNTSDFIGVQGSTQYYVSPSIFRVAFYNASKAFINYIDAPTLPITTPSNAVYLKYSYVSSTHDSQQLEVGSSATTYDPFGDTLLVTMVKDKSIDGIKLKDRGVTPEKLSDYVKGKNLFNKDTVTTGKFINQNSGLLSTNADYNASDWIAISPNTAYTLKNSQYTAFYDANKTYISGFAEGQPNTFTTPANAAYMRTSAKTSQLATQQLELGSASTSYESYGYRFNSQLLPDKYLFSDNKFKGLNLCVYGDSITASNLWATDVFNAFSFGKLYNRGWSDSAVTMENKTLWINADGTYNNNPLNVQTQPAGTTAVQCSFCHPDRIAYVPTDTDIVLIMGGTNDFLRHQPLGSAVYPYDEYTFKGALASTHKKIQEKLPNATIVFMTPIQMATAIGDPTPRVNYDGLVIKAYAEAVREVADYLGCALIDVYKNSGINLHNTVQTSGDGVHPTIAGHKLISKAVIGGLKSLLPIA